VDVHLYPITGGGLEGYWRAYRRLRRFLKGNSFDILHGHYSLSAIIAALASGKKTVASLMGSDVLRGNLFSRAMTRFFARFAWDRTIVKSRGMKERIKNAAVLPNGVDLRVFKPLERAAAREKTGFSAAEKHIIFVAEEIHSRVKNFKLAEEAVQLLDDPGVRLHPVSGHAHEELVYYYNVADLLLLTSRSEGSPNVVKEAMACNCPVVSTDVGDVGELIAGTAGCYLVPFDPRGAAAGIRQALDFGKRTDGRERIRRLDSRRMAQKIIDIYRELTDDRDR
jgi:glycosyltransferase involved in cell wall biosynthesis